MPNKFIDNLERNCLRLILIMPAANVDKIANGSMTNGKISKPVPNNLTNGTVNNNNNNHNGTATSNIFQEPQKIANIIIEKKIRNLEKRKVSVNYQSQKFVISIRLRHFFSVC